MKDSTKYVLIDKMKSSRFLQPIYNKLKRMGDNILSLDSINTYTMVEDSSTKIRINLVLPTLRRTKVFGGINTAINIFKDIVTATHAEGRIIVLNNETEDKKWEFQISGYSSKSKNNSIHYLAKDEALAIREKDYFLFTSWRTFYTLAPIISWHSQQYGSADYRAIYLIQDFEPGFYPWSTEYVLSESTYRTCSDQVIAIFNSQELYDYFKINHYTFAKELIFRPSLNTQLKEILLSKKSNEARKKQILIYGRPSEHRNAFEIIRFALKQWSETYDKAGDWNILSLGESFDEIELKKNKIISKGKVTLDEYAGAMFQSYVGISLMISPHPSYPPLEMSTFGVKTITNSFMNKDLSRFNRNIISIHECTPEKIANKLIEICEQFGKEESILQTETDYVRNEDFTYIGSMVASILNESENDNVR